MPQRVCFGAFRPKSAKKHSKSTLWGTPRQYSKSTPWDTFRPGPLGTSVNGGWDRNGRRMSRDVVVYCFRGTFDSPMPFSICGASLHCHPNVALWSSLITKQGASHFFGRYGVCLSHVKGHQAFTDPPLRPPTPVPPRHKHPNVCRFQNSSSHSGRRRFPRIE